MRAVVVDELGAGWNLREIPEPTPGTGAGESLVRVRAAAVSHLDLQLIRGQFSIRPRTPFIAGTECSGEIVTSDIHSPGTPVRIRGAGVGISRPGSWAEQVAAPNEAITVLDEADHWDLAASFFSPAATAWAALHDVAVVAPGERVAVTGATGAVGLVAVQLAAQHGCDVVGIVGSDSKRDLVPPDVSTVAVYDAASGSLKGVADGDVGLFDAVVDTVGGGPLAAALSQVKPGGRVALVGYTAGDRIEIPISRLLLSDVSLLPTNLLRRGPALAERGRDLLARLGRGELELPVTAYDLSEVARAFEAVEDRSMIGRVVVHP